MGCPTLGIWVAFLKQPDALPGRAPQKIKIIYFWTTFDSFVIFYFLFLFFRIFFEEIFFWGASPGSAGCFIKPTQIPNAGHTIWFQKYISSKHQLSGWDDQQIVTIKQS
jgi:hypothetical protein